MPAIVSGARSGNDIEDIVDRQENDTRWIAALQRALDGTVLEGGGPQRFYLFDGFDLLVPHIFLTF